MIIVFFEYDTKLFFFGVTSGKRTTRCSLSRDDVAHELAALQNEEWGNDQFVEKPNHVQGVVLRRLKFVEGRWALVDIEDGMMTVIALDGDDCFLISSTEPGEVYVADDADATDDFVDQTGSYYGPGG